jgi:cytochrome d ubiquinol oxidase subunit II
MHDTITLILAAIVGFAIIMYVILDGFDLGIGIMYPWVSDEKERHTMMQSVLPVWDGNETWLVLGGATLYGAFPLAYSMILPTLYIPIMIMLGALVFRGVCFEFLHHAERSKTLWTFFFSAGSTVAAFCQGVVLGTFVQGYGHDAATILVGHYKWLTAFSMFCGIAVVFGYCLLGATWLIKKTENELQQSMRHRAKILLIFVALFMLLVSIGTPFVDSSITQLWFSFPNMLYLAPLPIVTLLTFIYLWRALHKENDNVPFYASIALFLLAYIGFAISVWPYIIPRAFTIWQAAAPLSSQMFILVGLVILLPVLLFYTAYSYKVFKGKVHIEHGHGGGYS